MSFKNNYCGLCGDQLGPDDFDGICGHCDVEIEENDGAPPDDSVTCPVCNGYGLYPVYSFTEMSYEAEDCPKCGGDGWIIEEVTG